MGLLHELGYRDVRHYAGGLKDWIDQGLPLESPASALPIHPAPVNGVTVARPDVPRPAASRRGHGERVVEWLGNLPTRQVLLVWAGVITVFGAIFWAAGEIPGEGLLLMGKPVPLTLDGLATAVYFSFVTALSIGYGDIIPVGLVRILAVAEGATAVLIFGFFASKLVSSRQEQLIEEIHRIAFEDRLGRVRTNLHLVLAELQAIAGMCSDPAMRHERVVARIESAATVFAGELRTIHELLYRPQHVPDELVLQSILASLAAGLRELDELLRCGTDPQEYSVTLAANLRSMRSLADEICGECVPRAYAQDLKDWMDRVQVLARQLL